MLTAVQGYYNGTHIVTDEQINLRKGQKVIITVLEPVTELRQKNVDLRKYMGRGDKMFHGNADGYVKELRSDDRI